MPHPWSRFYTHMLSQFQMSVCLSNLLLIGCATPFFHNGSLQAENDPDVKVGIEDRNSIGYLQWDRTLEKTIKLNIGSRLIAILNFFIVSTFIIAD